MIPESIYKTQKNDIWESNILDKWQQFSATIESKEEAIKEFLQLITSKSYYG